MSLRNYSYDDQLSYINNFISHCKSIFDKVNTPPKKIIPENNLRHQIIETTMPTTNETEETKTDKTTLSASSLCEKQLTNIKNFIKKTFYQTK